MIIHPPSTVLGNVHGEEATSDRFRDGLEELDRGFFLAILSLLPVGADGDRLMVKEKGAVFEGQRYSAF